MESNERDNRRVGIGLTIAVGGIVVLAATWIVGDLSGRRLDQTMERRWEAQVGSREDLHRRFPTRGPDDLALEVERLAAALGADIAPLGLSGRPRPAKPAAGRFRHLRAPLGGFLTARVESPRREAASAPDAVELWLGENRDTLDELRERLVNGRPRWERDLAAGPAAPDVRLVGMIELHKVLLADALVLEARGSGAEALRSFEASWNLAADLRDTPNLVALMSGMTVTRLQAGTLRQLKAVPREWIGRLRGQDWLAALSDALWAEGHQLLELIAADDEDRDDSFIDRAVAPYARMCRADLGGSWVLGLSRLTALPRVCDADLSFISTEARPSSWNKLGSLAWPDMGRAAQRAARVEFDLELTAAVIATARGERPRPSRVCPGAEWSVTTDGGIRRVALTRETRWPDARRPRTPVRFAF